MIRSFTSIFKIGSLIIFFALISIGVSAQKVDTMRNKINKPLVDGKVTTLTVRGTINDAAAKKPISGISISSDLDAAITDNKGNFTLKVPSYTAVLTVSGPGYLTKQVPLKGKKGIVVVLYEDSFNSLYSVAEMPFGKKPINTLNNSASSINIQGAWESNQETADSYLQGKVAGLNVIRKSGTPNIGTDLFLRGYSSLYATNKPLLVVDGLIFDNAHYGSSLIGGHYNNPLANIDINDIDNITVVKDGLSMYGTKGANGVILITTGHTNELATKIDFGVYTGFNIKPKNMKVLGPDDYRVYLSDMLKSSGQTDAQIAAQPYMNDNVNSGTYYNYHNNTDWQRQVFKNSFNQNYYLKVSGGDAIAKYTLSLGYGNDGSITQNTGVNKYNTRFNADLKITRKFTIQANLSFTYNEQNLFDQGVSPKTNPIFLSLVKSPFLRLHQVNAQGAESPNYTNLDIFNIGNPRTVIDTANEVAKSYRFFGSLNFKYQFNNHLALQSLLGVTYDKVRESYFVPRSGIQPDTISNPYITGTNNAVVNSRLGSQVQRLYSLNNDTHLSYDNVFGRIHQLNINLGVRTMSSESQDDFAKSYNSPTDQFVTVDKGLTGISTGGELGDWLWMNNYLNINYNLLNRYFVTYNMGVDASSRFGTDIPGAPSIGGLKYAVLPSISAGWLVSSEKFMSGINFVELLKLRAGYGLTGNDDIGNYNARQYYISQNFLSSQGITRANFGNPNLQWEANRKINFGLDASLFKERLAFTVDVYRNTTSKMLINEPQPATAGLVNAIANDGGMQTQGIDISVNGRIINTTKLKWDIGVNISSSRNKITVLPGNSMTTQYAGATILTQVGSPAGLFYGYKTNGIYRSEGEAITSGIKEANSAGALLQPHGGDVKFVDINGDKIIDANDFQVIGNPNPDFTGGISSNITYKRFSFNALITFSKGGQIFNYVRQQLESQSNLFNQTPYVLNRWRADGQITDVPKQSYGDPIGNSRFSDRWIEDGSYIRLRTATVMYNVPLKANTSIRSIKVYLTGNNLLTLTKYLGYDPESSATESILTQGIDTGLEPQFKSVQLGIRLGL